MFAPSSTAALLGLLLGTLSVSSSPLAPRWSSSNPAANTANSSTTTDLPLAWTPFGFVTDAVEIGTPAQKIPSFVDWTWIGQYAFSTLCNDSTADTYDCLAKDQTIFNQSASSTFENQSSLYPERNWNPNHFFFYKDLKVEYGSDIERVGGVEGRVTIMAADMDFNLSTKYPFAGVFGLSPVFDTDNASTSSPFHQLWKAGAFASPIVAFHYCYNGSADATKLTCHGADGLQTLGGYNPSLVKGEIVWYDNIVFPAVNDIDFVYSPALLNYWALPLTQLSLGDEPQALNESAGSAAIFDHASYGRGAPLSVNAYDALIRATEGKPISFPAFPAPGAPNNGNQSFVQVDCAKVDTFPVLKYQFGKHTKVWEIEPRNYVEDITTTTGGGNPGQPGKTCVLNVRTLGEGDYQVGNFGETFAKDKYVLFDFEKLRIGIADLNW